MQDKVLWFNRDQALIRQFKTGVSIHSHTGRSKESLAFIGSIFNLILCCATLFAPRRVR